MADASRARASSGPAPRLDELMLAMDVVDTLRHQEKLVERELAQEQSDEALKARLRQIYESQGLVVDDRILEQGIAALKESRFVYTPPGPGLGTFLAKLWIRRGTVGRVGGAVVFALAVFIGWQVWQEKQTARKADMLRIELVETLPARLQEAGKAALAAARTASARAAAEALIAEGNAAASARDGTSMRAVFGRLETLRAELSRTYKLTVVSREGEKTGVYRIPDINQRARNYYIIVEAVSDSGEVLPMPIRNEENGRIETVSKWGVRVPKSIFEAVRDDKSDDGIVQKNILGEKRRGTLEIDYLMPVEGGAITQW